MEVRDEKEVLKKELHANLLDAYGDDEDEANYAVRLIRQINDDLELREQHTMVFNGMPYSRAYAYNQRKSINYAPPRAKGAERDISLGLVHEKIIAFCAFFLKYQMKRRVKCRDENGKIIENMGDIYDLGIEHSYRLESFKKLIALIYFELFSQGDAWVQEEWEVKNVPQRVAYDANGKKVDTDRMDYTLEFLDGLKYEEGEMVQTRRARSRLRDGRTIILGNPEIEEVQDQPRVVIEELISDVDADLVFGSLKRFDKVPDSLVDIKTMVDEKVTLFDAERLGDPKHQRLVHWIFDKENNRYNVALNGVMLLPRDTTLTIFYPRGNYPISRIASERIPKSAYSRSVPMKTKFNADFVDWALTKLAERFEQGIDPALLVKGKYTLTKDLFKGGQRTHGISRDDYEKADPENKGMTNNDLSFVTLLKEILESQTLNSTTTGEIADQATATGINAAQSNQIEKLGFMLDGVVNGFYDMAMRRAETIESKYTVKQRETLVDGKKVAIYSNFTVSMDGTDFSVVFDEEVGTEGFDEQAKKDELFEASYKEKQEGQPSSYYLANPKAIRRGKHTIDIEIIAERRKDTYLQIMEMREDFKFLRETFGNMIDTEGLKEEYLTTTGKPGKLFIPAEAMKLNDMMNAKQGAEMQGNNTGSFGQPKITDASRQNAQTA